MHVAASVNAALTASAWRCTRHADNSSCARVVVGEDAERADDDGAVAAGWQLDDFPVGVARGREGLDPFAVVRGDVGRRHRAAVARFAARTIASAAHPGRRRAGRRPRSTRAPAPAQGCRAAATPPARCRRGGTSRGRRARACALRWPTRLPLRSRVGSRCGRGGSAGSRHVARSRRAEPAVELAPGLHQARHGHRRAAGPGHRAVGWHEPGGEGARAVVAVDVAVVLDEREEVAAEPGAHGLHHSERGVGGDGGVDRAPAAAERLERGRGPERRRRRHHHVRRDGRRPRDREPGGDHVAGGRYRDPSSTLGEQRGDRVAGGEHDPPTDRVEDPVVGGHHDAEQDGDRVERQQDLHPRASARVATARTRDHVDQPTCRLGIAAKRLPYACGRRPRSAARRRPRRTLTCGPKLKNCAAVSTKP